MLKFVSFYLFDFFSISDYDILKRKWENWESLESLMLTSLSTIVRFYLCWWLICFKTNGAGTDTIRERSGITALRSVYAAIFYMSHRTFDVKEIYQFQEINPWKRSQKFRTQEKKDSILFPQHLRVILFPSSPKLRPILFPSPPKLRAILFLFRADLRAKSTTFSNLSICYAYFF